MGLIPFMAPIYAALIVIVIYFGIKFYIGNKRKSIEKELGEGICADCGSKISNQKCSNCNSVN